MWKPNEVEMWKPNEVEMGALILACHALEFRVKARGRVSVKAGKKLLHDAVSDVLGQRHRIRFMAHPSQPKYYAVVEFVKKRADLCPVICNLRVEP
jgi:hypothetical protein